MNMYKPFAGSGQIFEMKSLYWWFPLCAPESNSEVLIFFFASQNYFQLHPCDPSEIFHACCRMIKHAETAIKCRKHKMPCSFFKLV